MLPGNNMHFIFFPCLCFYHLRPHPPLSSPFPSPFIPSVSALSSLLHPLPRLFSLLCSPLPLYRLSVVPDLCGTQGAHEGKTHASHAWDLQHAPGSARYTKQWHSRELQTNVVTNMRHKFDFFFQHFLSQQNNTVQSRLIGHQGFSWLRMGIWGVTALDQYDRFA